MRPLTCTEFNAHQLSFEAFSHIMRISGSVQPQSESTFPFFYIIIFQRWEFFKTPSSTPGGEIDTCVRELFRRIFNLRTTFI